MTQGTTLIDMGRFGYGVFAGTTRVGTIKRNDQDGRYEVAPYKGAAFVPGQFATIDECHGYVDKCMAGIVVTQDQDAHVTPDVTPEVRVERPVTPAPKPAKAGKTAATRVDPVEAKNRVRTQGKRVVAPVEPTPEVVVEPVKPAMKPSEARAARLARQAAEGKNGATRAPRGEKAACSTEGCENPVHAKGICAKCYNAARSGKAKAAREAAKAATVEDVTPVPTPADDATQDDAESGKARRKSAK